MKKVFLPLTLFPLILTANTEQTWREWERKPHVEILHQAHREHPDDAILNAIFDHDVEAVQEALAPIDLDPVEQIQTSIPMRLNPKEISHFFDTKFHEKLDHIEYSCNYLVFAIIAAV